LWIAVKGSRPYGGFADEIPTWEDESMRDSYREARDELFLGMRCVHPAVTQ
jgi:hypothetical protein